MPYIEGFVAAVPTANKETYRKHAKESVKYFKKLGATRCVECWGDDVEASARAVWQPHARCLMAHQCAGARAMGCGFRGVTGLGV